MLSETDIIDMILGFAARCGDPTPSAIRYVYGTRGELNTVLGAEMHGDDATTPAVLVQAIGDFTWHHSAPMRARGYSHGNIITLIIDETTGVAVDRGIAHKQHDLSSLGEVHHPAVPK